MSNYVQLGTSLTTSQLSESDAKMSELNFKIAQKKAQVERVSHNFEKMNEDLHSIKSQFDQARKGSEMQLHQLKQESQESQDTKLAKLFEKESISLRNKLK